MPQVDVTWPAECREAEAERRDGKAGSSEQARWQVHGRIPGGSVTNLLTPEILRNGPDLAMVAAPARAGGTPMCEETALLGAILTAPDDEVVRLVFADLLEE